MYFKCFRDLWISFEFFGRFWTDLVIVDTKAFSFISAKAAFEAAKLWSLAAELLSLATLAGSKRNLQTSPTMAVFGNFLSKMYLRRISILGRNEWHIKEIKGTSIVSILKDNIFIVPLFFLIDYSLVH